MKRYGPVPTGLRLLGASRERAPWYGANRCLGIICSVAARCQIGVGLSNTTRTVCASTFSTALTLVYAPGVKAPVAESVANCQLNTTSSALNGAPSCQVTPRLSFHVVARPSA